MSIIISCTNYNSNKKTIHVSEPVLNNNPTYDVILTNVRPLFTFYNPKDENIFEYTFELQVSAEKDFNHKVIHYNDIAPTTDLITSVLTEQGDALDKDDHYYYWRVRSKYKNVQSNWVTSRFYLSTTSDDSFMNLVRVPVKDIWVNAGANKENIIDITDIGNTTHWEPPPKGDVVQWVKFEFEKPTDISRIWLLSNPNGWEGRLISFYWEYSLDGKTYNKIESAYFKDNDTYRNIINIHPVKAKYMRITISDYYGYAPQIFTTIFYSPGTPAVPEVPDDDYVLIIGDQLNGYTFTMLEDHVKNLNLGLKTITIPHYEISLDILNKLNNQPVAIIFSGNNANYPNLPMYEFNGGFEIVRNSNIPILGICAGHQLEVLAHGYSYAHSTGWFDNTILNSEKHIAVDSVNIIVESPLFKNIKNPFYAVEIHSWATSEKVFDLIGYEVLAKSSYVQAQKVKGKLIFGNQFHPEVEIKENEGANTILNFLNLAKEHHTSK